MDGNVLAAGEPDSEAGRVQVYARSNEQWNPLNTITPIDEAEEFGAAVDVSVGSFRVAMAVGAPQSREGFLTFGAAFYYELTGASWTQRGGRLVPLPSPQTADGKAGAAVAVAADTRRMVVGAPEVNFDLDNLENVRHLLQILK